jgi:hypothetical protein
MNTTNKRVTRRNVSAAPAALPEVPEQSLAPLAVAGVVAPSKPKASEVGTIKLNGNIVQRYNKADADEKAAKETKTELRSKLEMPGVDYIVGVNCQNPDDIVKSVKVVDDTGSVACVMFQDKYSSTDASAVCELFRNIQNRQGGFEKVNDYVERSLAVSLDQEQFRKDNKFNVDVYNHMFAAMQDAVANWNAEHPDHQIANPLVAVEQVRPVDNFHAKRFKAFGKDANLKLSTVLKNTVAIKPEAPAKKPSEARI